MAIHGTHEMWPVNRPLTAPGSAMVIVGNPIEAKDFEDLDELVKYSREQVVQLHEKAKQEWKKMK